MSETAVQKTVNQPEVREPQIGDVVQLGRYLCFIRKRSFKGDYVLRRIRKDQMNRIRTKE